MTQEPAVEPTEIDNLKAQVTELTDNWKRTAADFENYKRRSAQEKQEMLEYGKEQVILQLLASIEMVHKVISQAPNDEKYKDWLSGLRGTIKNMDKTLEEVGLRRIPIVQFEKFDHEKHEAVSSHQQPQPKEREGTVYEELEPGYTLNGRVIKHSKVSVCVTQLGPIAHRGMPS